ncbi:6-phospho-3-hexuloisomerase [Paenibacillus sp. 8b26]|uniref:6-phospho-3-hexuloisomerase n=1 Tax=Paenibacillus sp. 8b26 TaxID=3424133 RepID=UPI003D64EBFA
MKEFKEIINEIETTGSQISDQEVSGLVNQIQQAKHIFVAGAGRSGLMIRAFANRLLHLGYSVSVVGEINSPHTKEGDLLLIASGSGETSSLINQAKTAKENKVKIALITTNTTSTLGHLADAYLIIPAHSKKDASQTLQPMGALFEQTSLLLFDSLVLYLMKQKNETNESMKKRHADLE